VLVVVEKVRAQVLLHAAFLLSPVCVCRVKSFFASFNVPWPAVLVLLSSLLSHYIHLDASLYPLRTKLNDSFCSIYRIRPLGIRERRHFRKLVKSRDLCGGYHTRKFPSCFQITKFPSSSWVENAILLCPIHSLSSVKVTFSYQPPTYHQLL